MSHAHPTSGASLISLITLTTVNGFAAGPVTDKHTLSHFALRTQAHTQTHSLSRARANCQDIKHTQTHTQQQEGQLLWATVKFAVSTEGPSRFTS